MSNLKPESLRNLQKASQLGYGGMEFNSSSLATMSTLWTTMPATIVKWIKKQMN